MAVKKKAIKNVAKPKIVLVKAVAKKAVVKKAVPAKAVPKKAASQKVVTKEVGSRKSKTDEYANIPPEHDGRPWYIPPKGYAAPPPGPTVPKVEGVAQQRYEEVVRQLLIPKEQFWRSRATRKGVKKFVSEKTKPARALVDRVLKSNAHGVWPTLDDCIPVGSILDVVDEYFWENTDIPRELPFFNVMHYLLAKLMQEGIEIHKGSQVILPDVWTVVVAPSGAGKTMTQKALAAAMGGPVKLLPTGAKTSLQFLTYLRDHRLGLLLQDEFAQFLKSVSKDTSMQDVRGYMLQTYDNASFGHASTKSDVQVTNSAIGVLGYTPTATLTKYLTREMMDDGFAQRFAYCVAERDNRPIVGDYDFDDLTPLVQPLWNAITKQPFHRVYQVGEMGRAACDRVVQIIIGDGREEGIDDSFSRRLAFSTYKYALAYHILTGRTDDIISAADVAFGAKLTALHLLHMKKVLNLFEKPKLSAGVAAAAVPESAASISTRARVKGAPISYAECVERAKKKIGDFAKDGKLTTTRLLGGYIKVEKAVLVKILAELSQDPAYASDISLPER